MAQLSEARALGLKRYFTGTPCAHGHISERMVSNRRCTDCLRDIRKATASQTLERRRVTKKAWDLKNEGRVRTYRFLEKILHPEKLALRDKRYRGKNLGKCKEWCNAYKEKNKERLKDQLKAWRTANREAVRIHRRNRRTRLKSNGGTHTVQEIYDLLKKQEYRCGNYLCRNILLADYHADHIVAISRGGHNGISNIQLLCPFCYHSKHNRPFEEWQQEYAGRMCA